MTILSQCFTTAVGKKKKSESESNGIVSPVSQCGNELKKLSPQLMLPTAPRQVRRLLLAAYCVEDGFISISPLSFCRPTQTSLCGLSRCRFPGLQHPKTTVGGRKRRSALAPHARAPTSQREKDKMSRLVVLPVLPVEWRCKQRTAAFTFT